jgi:uncharacterized protein (TIGR04141 family)
MKLNIHLYRDDVKQFEECLRPQTPKRRFHRIGEGQLSTGTTYRLYLAASQSKAPPWVHFIQDHAEDGALEEVENTAHAAVILLQVSTSDGPRLFSVAHGHGHLLVNRDRIELGFGLKTALNAVDPDKLHLMDSRNVEVQTRQKRVASSASATLGGLDFEVDTEILRIVGGHCLDRGLAVRVEGSDSVHVTVKDQKFEALGEKCRALYETYRKDTYKARFEFIDHVGLVKEKALVQALEDHLAAALQAEQDDAKIALVCPDQIDQRRCATYQLSGLRGPAPLQEDLSLAAVYGYLRSVRNGHGLDRGHLRKVKILGLDEEGTACTPSEALLAYLVFETEHDGKRYVLSNDKWYHIDDAYLQGVERKLAALTRCASPTLVPWKKAKRSGKWMHHEEDYNNRYRKDDTFLVLDRAPFQKFGKKNLNSKVEFADLFHLPTKKLLCVKRWNGSPTMSHLLAQASVSAKLLRGLPEYRTELLRQVKKQWPGEQFPADPKVFLQDVSFVYVIGTDRQPPWSLDYLPVFSKVNMGRHVQTIESAGFNVEVTWVQMM